MHCGRRQHKFQSNDIIYPKNSLIKYESPRLIINHDISDADYKKICRATISPSSEPSSIYDNHLHLLDPYSDLCRPADILDFLFQPIEYVDRYNHKYVNDLYLLNYKTMLLFICRLPVYRVILQPKLICII